MGANTLFSKPGGGGLLRPGLPDAAGADEAADTGAPPAGISVFETADAGLEGTCKLEDGESRTHKITTK